MNWNICFFIRWIKAIMLHRFCKDTTSSLQMPNFWATWYHTSTFSNSKKTRTPFIYKHSRTLFKQEKIEIGIYHFISIGFSKRTEQAYFPIQFLQSENSLSENDTYEKGSSSLGFPCSYCPTFLLFFIFMPKPIGFAIRTAHHIVTYAPIGVLCCHLGIIAQISFNGCIVVNDARTGAGPSVINQCFGIIPGQLMRTDALGVEGSHFARKQIDSFIHQQGTQVVIDARSVCLALALSCGWFGTALQIGKVRFAGTRTCPKLSIQFTGGKNQRLPIVGGKKQVFASSIRKGLLKDRPALLSVVT